VVAGPPARLLLAPVMGQQCVGTLCMTWEEPEMKEFYAAAPQVGRILRPLAHIIGAPLPEWPQLPKRVRRKDTSRRSVVAGGQWWAEAHPTATALRDERCEMDMKIKLVRLGVREPLSLLVRVRNGSPRSLARWMTQNLTPRHPP